MILIPHAQGTPEWLAARAGVFTASTFGDLMAMTKSGPSTSRARLITKLAIERITGCAQSTFQNDAMRRGNDLEPFARAAYEAETGELVQTVGLALHDLSPFIGASMDGLVGADGLVEFKCPDNQDKHVQALRDGSHAEEYAWQIQGQLFVSGRQWCDAVSYDPRFPEGLQLAITRVTKDNTMSDRLEAACIKANAEADALVTELLSMRKAA
jgi:putative phage-type endonuclease